MSDDRTPHPDYPDRDSKGRILPGHTGNPKGRPEKRPPLDLSSPLLFANTLISIKKEGKTVEMTRREALINKMFEQAVQGKVTPMRILWNVFQEERKVLQEAQQRVQETLHRHSLGMDISDQEWMSAMRIIEAMDLSPYETPALRRKRARQAQKRARE